jgi:hypothetical protein
VTVLARDAARADAAATLIANAVDLPGHWGITRVPSRSLSPDSDLGTRLVTTDVAALSVGDVACALDRGLAVAREYAARGLIAGACLACQGQRRMIGKPVVGAARPDPLPDPLPDPIKDFMHA